MNRTAKILVAGATGMVGSAIVRKLLGMGHSNILASYHSRRPEAASFDCQSADHCSRLGLKLVQVDCTSQTMVKHLFEAERPQYVFIAAAKVGGIYANNTHPAQFIYENLAIQSNIIHCAYLAGVERLLFLGSSCIYPQLAPQPLKEEHLLTGLLEPTNEPYAIAKIAGIKMCEAYNRQYKTRFVAVMPTNLYGIYDSFDLEHSHVLPALIRKFHEAKLAGKDHVVVWGTGSPRREFLFVDDMADACVFVMNLDEKIISENLLSYPKPCFVNVGCGEDRTIRELAAIVQDIVGFGGQLVFDTAKPDGTPQKLLDISRLSRLGWHPATTLIDGIGRTYAWYLQNQP
jgi:GDP-L-fucose synthase